MKGSPGYFATRDEIPALRLLSGIQAPDADAARAVGGNESAARRKLRAAKLLEVQEFFEPRHLPPGDPEAEAVPRRALFVGICSESLIEEQKGTSRIVFLEHALGATKMHLGHQARSLPSSTHLLQ
jgi:hypothetical protein